MMTVAVSLALLTACGGGGDGVVDGGGDGGGADDTIKTLKKTGQTKSYDAYGNEVTDGSIKDDGFYQKGIEPSYTRDDASNIVTDHVTGLMWQDDAAVISVSKQWLTDANYATCSNDKTDPACFDTTGDTAATYCSELVMGGYEDWRLPTIAELQGIIDHGVIFKAMDSTFQNYDDEDHYWSSTSAVGDEDNAWSVSFDYGYVNSVFNKDHGDYVRCVRDGE